MPWQVQRIYSPPEWLAKASGTVTPYLHLFPADKLPDRLSDGLRAVPAIFRRECVQTLKQRFWDTQGDRHAMTVWVNRLAARAGPFSSVFGFCHFPLV
jgi:hypothetical protein